MIGPPAGARARPEAPPAGPAPARAALAARLAGRAAALLLALAVLAGALLFAWHSVLFLWSEVAPVYRSRDVNSQADFAWFFYAMQVAWLHASPARRLYDIASEDAFMRAMHLSYDSLDVYGYPPQFALFWSPLAALPYAAARTLWTQINLGALAVGLAAAAWQASPRFGLARLLVLGAAGLWVTALQSNFYWGQPNALTLALVALGLLGICRPRPRAWPAGLGGVALGLATVLKLTPIAVLCYLPVRWCLARRTERGRAAGLGAAAGWATVALTSVASGLTLGWSTLSTYVRKAIPAVERSAWAHGPAPWNQSLHGILMLYEHSTRVLAHQSDLFAVAVFAATVALAACRPGLDVRLEAALAALLALLPWPSLEDHHFTVAILPWILVGGYLLDRVASWRRAWLWPLAGLFAAASVGLIAPARLHWPPALLARGASIPVPAGRYSEVFLLGAGTYGPVQWTLRLEYRGAPAGAVAADWPDWWSPDDPLRPAIAGEAEQGGQVNNAHVGLYAFAYPVRPRAELTALRLPGSLPQQNGGPEGLHVVAVTLERASGGFVQVAVPYNTHGIAPSDAFGPSAADSFDGTGNAFWTPDWPAGQAAAEAGGTDVVFDLPTARAAGNTLSDPVPAGVPAPSGRRAVLATVFADAPGFVAIGLLFAIAIIAGALDAPPAGGGGR